MPVLQLYKVKSKKTYDVSLGFSRVGSLKYSCSCPYFLENKKVVCKHIIASALLWDRRRKVPDPDEKTIEDLSIPEPTITRKDINKAYSDPLHADLEMLRRAADEMGWTRSHARLPLAPKICKQPLMNYSDVKKAILELRVWSRRYSFDPYFCAGEMVAGFCELIRWVQMSYMNVSLEERVKIAQLLVNYNRELIMETIDDSDGLHEFTEAHLVDFLAKLDEEEMPTLKREVLRTLLSKITDY